MTPTESGGLPAFPYIKYDPKTGSAGYMIASAAGGLATIIGAIGHELDFTPLMNLFTQNFVRLIPEILSPASPYLVAMGEAFIVGMRMTAEIGPPENVLARSSVVTMARVDTNRNNYPQGHWPLWALLTGEYVFRFNGNDLFKFDVWGVEIVNPTNDEQFEITRTDPPVMPEIEIEAQASGTTAQTTYSWILVLSDVYHNYQCSNISREDSSNTWTANFDRIMGGNIKLNVTATINGQVSRDEVSASIIGIDPSRPQIRQAIGNDTTALKIACHESGMHQFNAKGQPIQNSGGGIDIGIFQIVTGQTCDDVWNWRVNVRHGLQILDDKRSRAAEHQVTEYIYNTSQSFAFCDSRDPVYHYTPTPLSTDPNYANDQRPEDGLSEREREAIRRFNGGREHVWVITDPVACTGYWDIGPIGTTNPDYVDLVLDSNCP